MQPYKIAGNSIAEETAQLSGLQETTIYIIRNNHQPSHTLGSL